MPLLWISIAFVIGIVLGKWLVLPCIVWIILGSVFLTLGLVDRPLFLHFSWWKRLRILLPISPGIILLFLSLGGVRFLSSIPIFTNSDLAFYNDRGVFNITARVSAPPDQRQNAVYLQVSAMEIEDRFASDISSSVKHVDGLILLRLPAGADWQYGDLLTFTGKPLTPSENSDFSYKDYLARQKIHTVIYYPQQIQRVGVNQGSLFLLGLEKLREKAKQTIFRQLPQPESGLLSGILLGLDNDLPPNLIKAYRYTGMSHIIAISGFNMAVLAGLFIALFTRVFNRYWAALLAALAIVTYTLFVGGSAAVIRAAIMSVTAFAGHLIGRRQSGLNALGFTATIMSLINPLLISDVSFQLSFMATLGLVLFAKPMQDWLINILEKWLPEEKVNSTGSQLSEFFLFTLAAQVTTLPVIVLQFGRFSISSILANPLILPVQPGILILGGISTVAGMLVPIIGKILSLLVWPLLAYTNRTVELFSRINGGSLMIHPQMAIWILVIFLIFLFLFLFRNFFKKVFGKRFIWLVFLLLLANISVGSILSHRPDGLLHVHLKRTVDESTLFLTMPNSKVVVVDPGKEINELSTAVSRTLSPWDFRLEAVLLTHRPASGTLELLNERIPIQHAWLAPPIYLASADEWPVKIPEGIDVLKFRLTEDVLVDSEFKDHHCSRRFPLSRCTYSIQRYFRAHSQWS